MSDSDNKMQNGYSQRYNLMIHFAHSSLQFVRNNLILNCGLDASRFIENHTNDKYCMDIYRQALHYFNYELSFAQMQIAISMFLSSINKTGEP